MNIEKIRSEICSFKKAITEAELHQLGYDYRKFKRFPQACCVLTSQLLSRYLKRNYPSIEFTIVNGEPQGLSHYWIEVNQKVIDITMSQKGIDKADIIFAKSLWHQECRRLESWPVDKIFYDVTEGADSATAQSLDMGLELVMSKIK